MPLVVLQTKHHVRPPPSTFTRGGAETISSSVLVIYGCLTDYSKVLRQHLVLGSSASARVWLTSSHKLQSACGLWPPQGSTWAGSRSTCPRVMLAGFSSSQAVGLRASVPTLPVSWKFPFLVIRASPQSISELASGALQHNSMDKTQASLSVTSSQK